VKRTVGEATQLVCRPCHEQTHYITEVVSGIGEESEEWLSNPKTTSATMKPVLRSTPMAKASVIDLMVVRMTHRFVVDGV
jgi:hypothetical protein